MMKIVLIVAMLVAVAMCQSVCAPQRWSGSGRRYASNGGSQVFVTRVDYGADGARAAVAYDDMYVEGDVELRVWVQESNQEVYVQTVTTGHCVKVPLTTPFARPCVDPAHMIAQITLGATDYNVYQFNAGDSHYVELVTTPPASSILPVFVSEEPGPQPFKYDDFDVLYNLTIGATIPALPTACQNADLAAIEHAWMADRSFSHHASVNHAVKAHFDSLFASAE
mmetsp:Transcript_119648/g.168341  ORF Transcript_119648/g.168341 Transcript_119648/m.168341 type:complete len:224 (+) Transcript_119648:8-679(+)